jgi:predicted SnoaL-like aldol condensation-catalyzing enzyme
MRRLSARSEFQAAASRRAADSSNTRTDTDADVQLYYVFLDQLLQRGAMDCADRFVASDFVEHGADGDVGKEAFIARLTSQTQYSPNVVWTIELLVSVGGLVICHTTIASAGAPRDSIDGWESVVVRFSDGKMVERWRVAQEPQIMVQIAART